MQNNNFEQAFDWLKAHQAGPEAEHDAGPSAGGQESLLISFEDADQGPEDNLPTAYNPFADTAAVNAGRVSFSSNCLLASMMID